MTLLCIHCGRLELKFHCLCPFGSKQHLWHCSIYLGCLDAVCSNFNHAPWTGSERWTYNMIYAHIYIYIHIYTTKDHQRLRAWWNWALCQGTGYASAPFCVWRTWWSSRPELGDGREESQKWFQPSCVSKLDCDQAKLAGWQLWKGHEEDNIWLPLGWLA